MRLWRTVGCNGVISGGLEIQGLGEGPLVAERHCLTGRRASNQFVCVGTLFRKRFYTLRTRARVGWLVGVAIDTLGGAVRAYAIHLLWHSRFFEALKEGMGSGGVATYTAALGVGLALRADSSRVAESPAEVALSGGVVDCMAFTGRTRMKRTMPFLMSGGASVEET